MLPSGTGQRGQRIHRENEKSNLLVVTRLVLRAFIEDALGSGKRMVEGETQLIADLLVILEKVLCHGFKGGKSILALRSTDSEMWIALRKLLAERADLMETVICVDNLDVLLTPISRIRCLLRLVMMQKKTVDLFQSIVQSPFCRDAYEQWALLRCEDADRLIGQLLGLSVVDCTLIIEYDHLQEQPSSVDLSPYIRVGGGPEDAPPPDESEERKEKRMLIEQKACLEERLRQMQTNMEILKGRIEREKKAENGISMRRLEVRVVDNEVAEEEEQEREDRVERAREDFDKERTALQAQVEKKEDEIRYTKQQLDDTTHLNKDLYEKLRVTEDAAKRRERELIAVNQRLAEERDDAFDRLEIAELQLREKNAKGDEQNILKEQFEGKCEQYSQTLTMLEKKQKELREARESAEQLRRWKEKADVEMERLKRREQEADELFSHLEESQDRVKELEKTLEEMGGRLSESQLKVMNLKEELVPAASWEDDSQVGECRECSRPFSITARKHHCRRCGQIFCNRCSSERVRLPSIVEPVRVCDACHTHLKAHLMFTE